METLKTIIAWFLSPFVIGMSLQLLGFLCLKVHRPKVTRLLLINGSLVLVLGGLPILSYEANRSRSLIHEPFRVAELDDPAHPTLIVVLGGGFDPDPWLPPNSRLNSTVMARLIEGVRVHRLLPNSRLLVSLSSDGGTPQKKQETLLELAQLFRLDHKKVDLITEAESTADEAELTVKRHQEGERVIVATSASHMPRALLTFADEGLEALAAPTDFQYPRKESAVDRPWKRWIPSSGGHHENKMWLYETVATLAQRLGLL